MVFSYFFLPQKTPQILPVSITWHTLGTKSFACILESPMKNITVTPGLMTVLVCYYHELKYLTVENPGKACVLVMAVHTVRRHHDQSTSCKRPHLTGADVQVQCSAHYHHGWKDGSIQADSVLGEELTVLDLHFIQRQQKEIAFQAARRRVSQ